MSLSGTHENNEPLIHKGSFEFYLIGYAAFYNIVDVATFLSRLHVTTMHKRN